jgi:hypothetical protein
MDKSQEKTAATNEKRKGPFPAVPTTKVLAIGRFLASPTPEQLKAIFAKEVPDTVRLYLAGKIDQWWVRQDQKGPVFLMNLHPPKRRAPSWTSCPWARRSSWNLISSSLVRSPRSTYSSQKAGRLGVNRLRSAWL